MSLSWLHHWVKCTFPARGQDRRAEQRAKRSPCRRRASVRPMLEQLEVRCLLSAQLSLTGGAVINSYAGVGFQENAVATLTASLNGQPDTNKGDFTAQIDWGSGQSSTGDLVYMGTNGSQAIYTIKGSNIYQQTATNTPITVTVNGPEGSSTMDQTAFANVASMPSSFAGEPPNQGSGFAQAEDVQVSLTGGAVINSYAGVGFQENAVATLTASLNGQPDTSLSDFTAQINWGDSSSWGTGDLVYMGTNGSQAIYTIKGSHIYQNASSNTPIVVYVNGPDGTSTSDNTAWANVNPMPSGFAGKPPNQGSGFAQAEDVQVSLTGGAVINAVAGQAFGQTGVATLTASLKGQPDTSLSDFTAQINWGDSASWDKGTLEYQGTNGSQAIYLITGSHTYGAPSSNTPIVVYVNGPDGTSTSDNTAWANVSPNPNPPLTLTPGTLPDGTVSTAYNQTITASGGNGDLTVSDTITSGSIPDGLNFNISGNTLTISGTPTVSGSVSFSVTATDSDKDTVTQDYTLTVNDAPITISPSTVLNGTVGAAYNQTITASGGNGDLDVSDNITSTTTPADLGLAFTLNLNNNQLLITGTPTTAGTVTFSVTASDSSGIAAAVSAGMAAPQANNSDMQSYTLTVNPASTTPITFSPTTLTAGTAGQLYQTQTISASGGNGSLTMNNPVFAAGSSADGLTFTPSGNQLTISGTPAAATTINFTVTATDTAGTSPPQSYTLTINPANTAPSITNNPTSQTVPVGAEVLFTASASGSPTPAVQWQVRTNSLAPWSNVGGGTNTYLALQNVTAAMSGYEFQAVFTNSAGSATTSAAMLTVNSLVILSNPVSQTVLGGQTATFTASASSGVATPTVQWQVRTNSLAPWSNVGGATNTTLTLNNVTTAMSGYEYQAVFTNSAGSITSTAATLTVTSAPSAPVITSSNTANFTVNQNTSVTVTATGSPTPILTESGPLPVGVSFIDNGNGTGTLSGTPAAGQNGTYTFTITASNTSPTYQPNPFGSVPSNPSTAPTQIVLPPSLTGQLQNLWNQSNASDTEWFGTLIDEGGQLSIYNSQGGGSTESSHPLVAPPGATILGDVHTHPIDNITPNANPPSAPDIANVVLIGQIQESLVQSGSTQWLLLRTAQANTLPPGVTAAGLPNYIRGLISQYQQTYTQNGVALPEAYNKAVAQAAAQVGVAVYQSTAPGTMVLSSSPGSPFVAAQSVPTSSPLLAAVSVPTDTQTFTLTVNSASAPPQPLPPPPVPAPLPTPPISPPPSISAPPAPINPIDQLFIEFEQLLSQIEAEITQLIDAELAIFSNLRL